jgi:DNA-binding transcriptional LysR family regulator
MVPTPLAESLAETSAEALGMIHAAIKAEPFFDPATSQRTFTVCFSDYVETLILPEVLRMTEVAAPNISFEVLPVNEAGMKSFENGDVDLIVVPETKMAEHHPRERLFQDKFVCVSWTGNPDVPDPISLERYLIFRSIIGKFGQETINAFDDSFIHRHEPEHRVDVVGPRFTAVPHLLVGTNRVSIMPVQIAAFFARMLPLRVSELDFEGPDLMGVMQWNKFAESNPSVEWLRGILRESARVLGDASRPTS